MNKPRFYDPQKIDEIFLPRLGFVKEEAFSAGDIKPSSDDAKDIKAALLLIDCQIDFCSTKGSLFVPGAGIDIASIIDFIFANFERITTIYPTLDTHLSYQIFYSTWWKDAGGRHPEPFTIITQADIASGKYTPLEIPEWTREYVRELETNANKPLCIWPEHTMLGTPGHALVPALYEACFFHSIARKSQIGFQPKGDLPESEMYGVFAPEVHVQGEPKGGINEDLLELLDTYDKIIVAGEAKSHCVLESVKQMAAYFKDKPATLSKIHVLEDCMSSVRHPTVDFEAMARDEFKELARIGINFVKSRDFVI